MPSEGDDHDSRGRLAEPSARRYRVRHRRLPGAGAHRTGAVLLAALAPALTGLLLLHLLWPTHWSARGGGGRWLVLADSVMLVSVGLAELFLLVNAVAVAYAASVARDPAPVAPEPGTPAALLITYVPGGEPLSAVRRTLEGAVRVRHPGPLDVWLLDEGDDPEARMLCAELGVHHFTRLGVPEWNQEEGPHRAGTKHGNHNAWLAKHGDAYEILAAVETGHVPRPGFLERTTGYFRDPDVAFVVGRRADASGGTDAARWSRPSPFDVLVQRAGNRHGTPVLAGTGAVLRVAALRGAGGFHGSDAEDLTTGFEIHRLRNPSTGRYWLSVRTPDARPAQGGPALPAERAARRPVPAPATSGVLLRQYGKALFSTGPGRLLSYTLTLLRRPVTAATRLLGALSLLLACTHTAMGVWAVLPLATALLPGVVPALTAVRSRGSRRAEGGSPAVRPVRETDAKTEPALAATTPAGGN
ncbi:glycosyl transferase [Streptomyces sp. NPDC102402]|uniref:glycosyl transferase n=1 Tax=Streptomyces sp. NPDC102402 TaxID=3366169 RepID=UPI0037FB9BEC